MDDDMDQYFGSEEDEDDEDYYPEEVIEDDDDSEGIEEEEESSDGEEETLDDEWKTAADWQAPGALPAATWHRVTETLDELAKQNRHELTVLLMGVPGCGCSSTANSLLAEAVADVRPVAVAATPARTEVHTRRLESYGFILRIIDCPHLLTGEKVRTAALQEIVEAVGPRRIDVVLYVDRLDVFRVQPFETKLWKAITEHFGRGIWKRTLLCLTHGASTCPPGYELHELVEKRVAQLRSEMGKCGAAGDKKSDLPYAIIDNSSRCPLKPDTGEKKLADGTLWLPTLWSKIGELALQAGPPIQLRYLVCNPNRKRFLLFPLLLAAQIAFKVYIFDRIIEIDGWNGDKNGEYDAATKKEHRMLAKTRTKQKKEEQATFWSNLDSASTRSQQSRQARAKSAMKRQPPPAKTSEDQPLPVDE